MSLLVSRAASLKRRAEALPGEVGAWIKSAATGNQFEKNASQLGALSIYMNKLLNRLSQESAVMGVLIQSTPIDTPAVLDQAQRIEVHIRRADNVWGYFRSKLEQRYDPLFTNALLVADLVAHDCYSTVMRRADMLGIKHQLALRDYPLTYLLTTYSPKTLLRHAQLEEVPDAPGKLPVPLIALPWDHLMNPWELLSLHHEVCHNIDADLNDMSVELGVQALCTTNPPTPRTTDWQAWVGEIFADWLGILLAGPCYASFMATFLTLPAELVMKFSPEDPHPPHYLRTLLNGAFLKTIGKDGAIAQYIEPILSQWKAIYPQPVDTLAGYSEDFQSVIDTMLSTKLKALEDKDGQLHSVNELAEFSEQDFERQLKARDEFLEGKEPSGNLPIRHIIGAAYMAVEKRVGSTGLLDKAFASELADRMKKAIISRAPAGQLALRTKRSTLYLQDLADAYYDGES